MGNNCQGFRNLSAFTMYHPPPFVAIALEESGSGEYPEFSAGDHEHGQARYPWIDSLFQVNRTIGGYVQHSWYTPFLYFFLPILHTKIKQKQPTNTSFRIFPNFSHGFSNPPDPRTSPSSCSCPTACPNAPAAARRPPGNPGRWRCRCRT